MVSCQRSRGEIPRASAASRGRSARLTKDGLVTRLSKHRRGPNCLARIPLLSRDNPNGNCSVRSRVASCCAKRREKTWKNPQVVTVRCQVTSLWSGRWAPERNHRQSRESCRHRSRGRQTEVDLNVGSRRRGRRLAYAVVAGCLAAEGGGIICLPSVHLGRRIECFDSWPDGRAKSRESRGADSKNWKN